MVHVHYIAHQRCAMCLTSTTCALASQLDALSQISLSSLVPRPSCLKPENNVTCIHAYMHNHWPGGRVQTSLWWWSYLEIGHFAVFHQYNFHFLKGRLHYFVAMSNFFISMVTSDNLKTQMRSSKTVTKQDIKIQPFNASIYRQGTICTYPR